jgi:hypothetical protein
MRVYYTKSRPDLAYSASRNAIGQPDSLLTAIEHAANGVAEWLYLVVGPFFWLAMVMALLAASGAL